MACSKRIVDSQQDQGSTIVCEFTLEDKDGNAVDTTGITFTFTGKVDAGDTDAEAKWQVITAGDGINPISCSVDSAGIPVGAYRYDIIAEQGGQREVYENDILLIKETVAD